jgi:hypothetical protein
VIDKLEVTVDPEVSLNVQFESKYRRVRKKPDKLYKEKASILPLGMKAILFRYCRFNARHKLSIVRISRMTIQEVVALVIRSPKERGPLKKAQASETLQAIDRQEPIREAIT